MDTAYRAIRTRRHSLMIMQISIIQTMMHIRQIWITMQTSVIQTMRNTQAMIMTSNYL